MLYTAVEGAGTIWVTAGDFSAALSRRCEYLCFCPFILLGRYLQDPRADCVSTDFL